MDKQVIITIGREFGSAGHFIAQTLSEKLGLRLYDKKLLEEIGFISDDIKKYDEKPINRWLSRRNGKYSNSIEEVIAHKTFDFIRELSQKGESFIVVGRCAEYVLRKNPAALKIFILGDKKEKLDRIMRVYELDEKKALNMMKNKDKQRKSYHNCYSDIKWGDSRGYDLCINSSRFGIEKTVEIILSVLKTKEI